MWNRQSRGLSKRKKSNESKGSNPNMHNGQGVARRVAALDNSERMNRFRWVLRNGHFDFPLASALKKLTFTQAHSEV